MPQAAAPPQQQPPQQPRHGFQGIATHATEATQHPPPPRHGVQQQSVGRRRAEAPPMVNGPAVQGYDAQRQDPEDTAGCTFVCALLQQQAGDLRAMQPDLECNAARRKMAAAAEWLRAQTTPQVPEDFLGGCTPASLLLALAKLCSSVLSQRMSRQHHILAMADVMTKQGTVRANKQRLQSRCDACRQQQHAQPRQPRQKHPPSPAAGMQNRHEQSRQQARKAAANKRRDALYAANSQLQYINNMLQQRRQAVCNMIGVHSNPGEGGGLWEIIVQSLHALKQAVECADIVEQHLLEAGLHLQQLLYWREKRRVVHGPELDACQQKEQGCEIDLGKACTDAQVAMMRAIKYLTANERNPLLVIVDTTAIGMTFGSVSQLWDTCKAAGPPNTWLATCSRQARGVWEVILANMFGVSMIACMCVDRSAAYANADNCTPCAALVPIQKHVDKCRKQMRGCCKHLRTLSHSMTPLPGFARPHLHMSDTFIKFMAEGLSKVDARALMKWRADHAHDHYAMHVPDAPICQSESIIKMAKDLIKGRKQLNQAPPGAFRGIFLDEKAVCKLSPHREFTGHVSTNGVALHVHFEHMHHSFIHSCYTCS